FKFADDDSAHPGNVTHDPSALAAPSSDLSGDHGPAAPALAKTFYLSDPAIAPASQQIGSDQFLFGKQFDHNPTADLKPDMPEIDNAKTAEIQHLLDTAQDTNATSPADPQHGIAVQDMPKASLPNQHDAFHLV